MSRIDVWEMGEDSEHWLVTGTDDPMIAKREAARWLLDTIGVEKEAGEIIVALADAETTYRDDWYWEPVHPEYPDEEAHLRHGLIYGRANFSGFSVRI